MNDDKRLIEDYLPIEAISKEASREKSVRKGHISTLHLWWARRPLVACRAGVYGALVPASQFVPANGPDNKKQSLGRANAARFVTELCKYPGSPRVIAEAQKHILDAHAERLTAELADAARTGRWPAWVDEFKWPKAEKQVTRHDIENGRAPRPRVLDMFAGGGAIPLEALRLGCEAYALDLNPVAHIIELCTLVYPQKYGKPDPSVPGMTGPRQAGGLSSTWGGLAEEVRYWGNWVLERVRREIGDLYPPIPDPAYKGKRSEIEFDRKTGRWVPRSGGRTGVPPVEEGGLFETRRHLPHWQVGGSVYFVTFSTRKVRLPDACRQIILDACRHWDGKKIRLHLACVMPDHVHAIMEPLSEAEGRFHDLSRVLHSIKSFAAHEVNKVLNRTGPLWEEESWDRIIRDEKDYEEKWNYILNNPVKAGLADSPERYPFLYVNAEARDATGDDETGETPVIPLEPIPLERIPLEPPPGYLTPVAYLWTRTVKCKNPACGATVPLVRQTWLCKKAKRYVALAMHATKGSGRVTFEVVESDTEAGLGFDPAGFSKAGNATCPFCGTVADNSYVKSEGRAGRMGTQPMAVVCTRPGKQGKVYISADDLPPDRLPEDDAICNRIADLCRRTGLTVPDEPVPSLDSFTCKTHLYGLTTFGHLFTPRQMLCLLTFAATVREAKADMCGSRYGGDEAESIATYLALVVNRLADWNSSVCSWAPEKTGGAKIGHTFGRQALPMVWDFAESGVWGDTTGSAELSLEWVLKGVKESIVGDRAPTVSRGSATALPWPNGSFDAVITDPPYYDNVSYANLSDFFYVWLKRSIGHLYPEHFATAATPKKQEAVADATRHGGDKEKAVRAYEQMTAQSLAEAHRVLKPGGTLAVVYAHKTTLGWSTLVDAFRRAGFTVTEAWPLDTEMKSRLIAMDAGALASSIFLVGRKRDGSAGVGNYEDEVQPELRRIVRERVETLWDQGITGADLVIASVGAGLRAFTRYERVEYANGEEVPAERFLAEVEGVVLDVMLEQIAGKVARGVTAVDPPSRFYVLWRYVYKAAAIEAGEAIVFTYAQHVELDGPKGLASGRNPLVEKKKGTYRLRDFTERGKDDKLGLPGENGDVAPLVDALHRVLWIMENRPPLMTEFLRESRVNRDRLRVLAQGLAGPSLKGGELGEVSAGGELAALTKLTANWKSVIEDAISPLERGVR